MNSVALILLPIFVTALVTILVTADQKRKKRCSDACNTMRQRVTDLLNTLQQIKSHPAVAVTDYNRSLDPLAKEIARSLPFWKRSTFSRIWKQYRYSKNDRAEQLDLIPDEYTSKGTIDAKRIIHERLHKLTSFIEN